MIHGQWGSDGVYTQIEQIQEASRVTKGLWGLLRKEIHQNDDLFVQQDNSSQTRTTLSLMGPRPRCTTASVVVMDDLANLSDPLCLHL